jgi:hypothetical protein
VPSAASRGAAAAAATATGAAAAAEAAAALGVLGALASLAGAAAAAAVLAGAEASVLAGAVLAMVYVTNDYTHIDTVFLSAFWALYIYKSQSKIYGMMGGKACSHDFHFSWMQFLKLNEQRHFSTTLLFSSLLLLSMQLIHTTKATQPLHPYSQ